MDYFYIFDFFLLINKCAPFSVSKAFIDLMNLCCLLLLKAKIIYIIYNLWKNDMNQFQLKKFKLFIVWIEKPIKSVLFLTKKFPYKRKLLKG